MVDLDVAVPVWSTVFVPSPQGMKYLVYDHTHILTHWTNRYILPPSLTTHVGDTAVET